MIKKSRTRSGSNKPFKQRVGQKQFSAASRRELTQRKRELVSFYGVQACLAIFKRRRQEISRVFLVPQLKERFQEVLNWCEHQGVKYKLVQSDELSRVAATEHHEGVCFQGKALKGVTLESVLKATERSLKRCILVL